jgi:hypothetical protein
VFSLSLFVLSQWASPITELTLTLPASRFLLSSGSHCAGTIASRKYGVAKKANVIAVKVLGSNGSGSMSDVVDGYVFFSLDQSPLPLSS